jgi:ABC-type transport system involved in multi-copper enzyme maturation permease subunit
MAQPTTLPPYPFALVRATWLLFRMHLGTIFGSRRTLAGIALALIPPVLGLLAANLAPLSVSSSEIFSRLGFVLLLSFVVPMLGVSLGVGVVADEAEGRTITYPFTRPIPRPALFLGRWLATLVCVLGLVAGSTLLLAVGASFREAIPPTDIIGQLMVAALVGVAVYSLGAAVIGVLFKRGLIVALGYAFAIEVLLASLPGSSQKMTLQYYLRSIFLDGGIEGFDPGGFLDPETMADPRSSLIRIAVVAAFLLVLGVWSITRKQFVLSS